jgi:hypothetical protein
VARAWDLYLVVSRNQNIGVDRVVRGDTTLTDWMPAFSLVNGSLPKDAITAIFPTQNNTRGLFAATRFQAARAGKVTFTLAGNVRGAWLNGQVVKPAAQFTVEATAGVNTLVLQLDEANLPAALKLSSGEASFVAN